VPANVCSARALTAAERRAQVVEHITAKAAPV